MNLEKTILIKKNNGKWILKSEFKNLQKKSMKINFEGESREEVLMKYDNFMSCFCKTEYYDENLTVDGFINAIASAGPDEIHFDKDIINYYNSTVKHIIGSFLVNDLQQKINERYPDIDDMDIDDVDDESESDPVRDFLEFLQEVYINHYYDPIFISFLLANRTPT